MGLTIVVTNPKTGEVICSKEYPGYSPIMNLPTAEELEKWAVTSC